MQRNTQSRVHLELENIGCLRHIEIELKPGLNMIKAPNASGKTSLIKGLASMFSDRIPPSHILALDSANGRIKVQYDGELYERTFRRTLDGSVVDSGRMLRFADHRAFDACVALAETGVVHKITGGGAVFREYLENLSYGRYYSEVISTAQEIVNESSWELAGPEFEKFEDLPLLLTELTELRIKNDQVKEKIRNVRASHEADVQSLVNKMGETESELSRDEMRLDELKRNLVREEEKEQQLQSFLNVTDDSSTVAVQMKTAITDSKTSQSKTREEIEKQTELFENLKGEVVMLRSRIEQKRAGEVKGLQDLEKELERVNKSAILKEEDIEKAERFLPDHAKYPGRLVIEVRREMSKKIEWLSMVIDYFQEKYMRRMTTARVRFNNNVTKAFGELDLEAFENVFLDQDFMLHLVRENSIQQPVETLSASEKLTISLILMLAAKETFLPDFPFFIIDELTLSYDPERFKHIVNYIKQRVPYVIVTALTSSGKDKPQVVYGA